MYGPSQRIYTVCDIVELAPYEAASIKFELETAAVRKKDHP